MNRIARVALLLFFFALCGTAILATHFAREQTPPPAARELYSVVNGQLLALRASDFGSAYRHTATDVQQKFSLPEFEGMVRRDFAPMTRARHVEFGAMRIEGTSARAQVFLTAPEGTVRGFLYSFTCEADGWKIVGVQPLGDRPLPHLPGIHI